MRGPRNRGGVARLAGLHIAGPAALVAAAFVAAALVASAAWSCASTSPPKAQARQAPPRPRGSNAPPARKTKAEHPRETKPSRPTRAPKDSEAARKTNPKALRATQGSQPSRRKKACLTIGAVGDIMFGRHVNHKLHPFGYDRPFRHVAPLLRRPDLTIGNLETPITSRRYFWMSNSVLVFRAKPTAAPILKKAGFDLMITANNHARDQKARGLLETIDHLRKVKLAWVGTGASRKEAFRPFIFKKNGITVGVIAAVTLKNYARSQRKGYFAFLNKRALRRRLPRMVKRLKKRVDFVVVSLHYGDEYVTTTTYRERRLVHRLVRAGADVVFGHHPHVLRGVQRIGGSVVFYSLGNFMFDMTWKRTDETGIARVVLERDGSSRRVVRAELIPVLIGPDFAPRPAKGKDARRILAHVQAYSKRFRRSSRLRVRNGRLVLRVPKQKDQKPRQPAGPERAQRVGMRPLLRSLPAAVGSIWSSRRYRGAGPWPICGLPWR